MESSPSSADDGFLSSPRAQRRLLWGSAGVLGIGLIIFLSVFVLRGSPGPSSPISTVPAQTAAKEIKAPPDPKAFSTARKFIETAVLRKNLDAAYPLVNQDIKGGMSKKQWDTGNIAVIGYPAENAKTAAFTVLWCGLFYKAWKMKIPGEYLMREFGYLLQELSLGKTRKEALLQFAERAPAEVVREFVSAVVQAEERGNPLAHVLMIQAESARQRRSVRGEELAAKAGIKMIGPCLCIFLCVVLLIGGPMFMGITDQFGVH